MEYRTFGYDGDGLACYFYFQRWSYINLGLHISLTDPNIEIHLPFGFFRLGWVDNAGWGRGWIWNYSRKDYFS